MGRISKSTSSQDSSMRVGTTTTLYSFVALLCLNVTAANIFAPGTKYTGWYDAPLGFGRTEFTATIETYQERTGEFSATGSDKQGDFTLKGKMQGAQVDFVKDFTEAGGYKDIKYKGNIENDEIKGTYNFFYRALFINLPINENFYMKVSA